MAAADDNFAAADWATFEDSVSITDGVDTEAAVAASWFEVGATEAPLESGEPWQEAQAKRTWLLPRTIGTLGVPVAGWRITESDGTKWEIVSSGTTPAVRDWGQKSKYEVTTVKIET